jgi:Holliday junction resolvase-like predicted endonuclease
VDYRKQKKIRKTALKFLSETEIPYDSVRFDVVGIVEKDGKFEIEHVEDAF